MAQRSAIACFTFVAIFATGTTGRADDARPTVSLSFAAPTGCPDETSFRDQVVARLAYDPFVNDAIHHVDIVIVPERGMLEAKLTLQLDETPAERQLSAEKDRCAPLVTALATTVAIALDSVRAPPQAVPTKPPPPPTPPPATTVVVMEHDRPPPPAPSPSPAPQSTPLDVVGAAGVVGSIGIAPGPTIGPEAGVSVGAKSFAVEASARVETTLGDVDVGASDHVQATVFTGGLAPCFVLARMSACALARVGAFEGRASTVTTPHVETTPFVSAEARLAYTQPISRIFGVRGGVSFGAPLVRTSLDVGGSSIWSAPPVFATLTLDLTIRLHGAGP